MMMFFPFQNRNSLFVIHYSLFNNTIWDGKRSKSLLPSSKKEEGEKDNKFILLFLTTIQRSGLSIPIRCHTRKPL